MKKFLIILIVAFFLINFLLFNLIYSSLNKGTSDFKNSRVTNLYIFFDGFPYFVTKKIQNDGFYSNFYPIARLVGDFPSLTDSSFAQMLGTPKSKSFPRRYFNVKENRRENTSQFAGINNAKEWEIGMSSSFTESWMHVIGYVFPTFLTLFEYQTMVLKLGDFTKQNFYAYFTATDSVPHIQGNRATILLNKILSAKLRGTEDLFKKSGQRDLKIVSVSDHGNNLLYCGDFFDLKTILEKNGFKFEDSIKDEKSIVWIMDGITTGTVFFTNNILNQKIAEIIIKEGPVEVVTFRENSQSTTVRVLTKDGEARIIADEEANSFKYETVKGDALQYLPVLDKIKEMGLIDSNGFVNNITWLKYSSNLHFPDAIYRIFKCHNGLSENDPSMMVSLRGGYTVAEPHLYRVMGLVGKGSAHGGLSDADTNGLLFSNFRPLPDLRPAMLKKIFDFSDFSYKIDKEDIYPNSTKQIISADEQEYFNEIQAEKTHESRPCDYSNFRSGLKRYFSALLRWLSVLFFKDGFLILSTGYTESELDNPAACSY